MNDFGMQQGEDFDMDFEAWLNDTANLIQSYNCNQTYSTLLMSIQEEEVSQLSDEINQSPNSDTNSNDSSEQALCNKDNPKRRKNHFGREYVCGRPLPLDVRLAIRDMFQAGGNACEIAVKLNITHGCASKILKRYKATGSVEAKKIGGSNPKKTVPAVVEAIIKHKTNEPQLKTWELRDRLIADAVCDTSSIPTIPSINRIIRLYFGRYYSRRKENGQSASAMKADDRSRERKIQAQDVQGTISLSWQSSSCSEASITSLDEFWLHPLSPGFQEGLMLTQSIIESQNDDLYGDNNAASFEYSIVC